MTFVDFNLPSWYKGMVRNFLEKISKPAFSFSFLFLLAFSLESFDIPKINTPLQPKVDYEVEVKDKYSDSFITSSDENYEANETYFLPGQKIYVRTKVSSSSSADAKLTLSDGNKNTVLVTKMTKSGDYYYSVVEAPKTSGLYYLRAEIKGEGISFIGEKNIYIDGEQNGNSSASVKVEIENVLNASDVDYEDTENKVENKTENDLINSNENPLNSSVLRIINNIIRQLIKEIFRNFSFKI